MRRRRFLAAAAAFGAASGARARASALEPIAASGADLAGDIRILREAYGALHPGLLRYLSQSRADALFDRLEAQFAARPPLEDAYLALSRALSAIRCGHTYANFYNQSDAVSRRLFAGKTRLPVFFRWIDGRMIVTRNVSGDARLAPGAEIVSINGVRAGAALRGLSPLVRADGGNDDKRRALLGVSGDDDYETFDIFHALMFPNTDGSISLKTVGADGRTRAAFDVAALDLDQRRASIVREPGASNPLGWTLSWPEERVARLTMPDWTAYNTKWDWIGWLDAVFAEIADRRAEAIIVDLRRNEGGNDCGDEIIARLIDSELRPDSGDRLVRYVKTPAALDRYLDTWDDSFRDRTGAVEPFNDRFFRLKSDGGRRIVPKGPRFVGKLAVLISPTNSSATFHFAALVREHRLGVLVGEATGGNQRGTNGGSFFFLRLPASGLEADLPLVGYFPKADKPDAGLPPDLYAAPTAASIRDGRDAALEAALKLFKR